MCVLGRQLGMLPFLPFCIFLKLIAPYSIIARCEVADISVLVMVCASAMINFFCIELL